MPERRSVSVTTKVTPAEYEQFQRIAGNRHVATWAYAVLRRAADGPDPFDVLQFAEQLATQRLLVNLFSKIATDQTEPLTIDVIKQLQTEIENEKLQRAHGRLGLVPQP
jgi:hypothetical protein